MAPCYITFQTAKNVCRNNWNLLLLIICIWHSGFRLNPIPVRLATNQPRIAKLCCLIISKSVIKFGSTGKIRTRTVPGNQIRNIVLDSDTIIK